MKTVKKQEVRFTGNRGYAQCCILGLPKIFKYSRPKLHSIFWTKRRVPAKICS